MAATFLGITDSVNTCDCCRKPNLKKTVALEIDGEQLHYGVNCAARALGLDDRRYTTKNAGQLAERVKARDKLRAEKARMVDKAEECATRDKCAYVVTRTFSNGRVHYGYMSEQTYLQQNKFGRETVHTARP